MSATDSTFSILHTESSIGWGGQEIRVLTEMRGFADRGHRVMLLTPPNAEIFPAAQRMGLPVTAIDIERKRLGPLLALRAWLQRHGKDWDVLNTHSSTDSWLAAIANATLSRPLPLVRTRHVSTAINNKRSTRWLYRRATAHIVTTGEALRQQLHADNGYPLDHMTSVRTGIDLSRYRALPKAEMRAKLGVDERPCIGILATLRDWKGHDYLLDAMALLRAEFPHWQLIVIGDGPQRERLQMRVTQMGLDDCIRFVGNVDNVPEWLSTLDVFTLPSFGDEGVPQGIMQAMACGLPVVSTPVGAIREAVQENSTGLIVPPRDAAALSAALGRLMRDESLRGQFGSAGHAYAQANFGIDVMIDRMSAVFAAAIAQSRNAKGH